LVTYISPCSLNSNQTTNSSQVDEAVVCTDFLASLGDQDCTADAGGIAFCTQGDTQIFGSTPALPFPETSTARCQDIARSAGRILDKCARLGGTIRGENGVEGNGDISVVISRVPQ
jgi:hypothetical protein